MSIAVITPSIPTRSQELCRAIQSVNQQSLPPEEHLIGVDYTLVGPAQMRNELIFGATQEWIAFLDDDDRLDAHHLETLAAYTDRADVIIPYCRFDGPPLPNGYFNRPYDRKALKRHGIFPITVLVRRDLVLKAGMFRMADRYEDHAMFNRIADIGGTFMVVPKTTWTYTTARSDRRTHL